MRTRYLAAVTLVFAIAACSDAASPSAMNQDALLNQAHSLGDNHQTDDNCNEGWQVHGRGRHHLGRRGYDRLHWGTRQVHGDNGANDTEECGGGTATATISGTVTSDGTGAASYPVYLLSADGATVVATTNTDATGAYSFAGVQAGTVLVCEDNPFTEARGFLAETRPNTGAVCTPAYGPLGFSLTAAGAALTGNNFINMRLD